VKSKKSCLVQVDPQDSSFCASYSRRCRWK